MPQYKAKNNFYEPVIKEEENISEDNTKINLKNNQQVSESSKPVQSSSNFSSKSEFEKTAKNIRSKPTDVSTT